MCWQAAVPLRPRGTVAGELGAGRGSQPACARDGRVQGLRKDGETESAQGHGVRFFGGEGQGG